MRLAMRRGLSTAFGALLITSFATIPATSASASAPSEVTVVPADPLPSVGQTDSLVLAGPGGFLHRRTVDSPYLWTSYADGQTATRTALDGLTPATLTQWRTDGDSVLVKAVVPGLSDGTAWTVIDLDTMTAQTIAVPAGAGVRGYYDNTLIYTANALPYLFLRRFAADGTPTDVPITGLPAGRDAVLVAADGKDAVVETAVGSTLSYALVDLADGAATFLPAVAAGPQLVKITDDRVSFIYLDSVQSFDRSAILDGSASTPDTVTLPSGTAATRVRVVGADAIVVPADDSKVAPALRYSPGSTTPATVVASAEGADIVQSHDGVLLVGGAALNSWAVHKVTETGDEVVRDLYQPIVTTGITLAQGYLRHIETVPWPGETPTQWVNDHALTSGADVQYASSLGRIYTPLACEDGVLCARTVNEGPSGVAYLAAGATTGSVDLYTNKSTTKVATLPTATGTVADASPEYVVVNGVSHQYVFDNNLRTYKTLPLAGAALWYSTLWSGSAAGYLTPTNLHTGAVGTKVATGSSCAASEVQATARYLYWTCGASGPSGVYDLAAKKNIALPAGQYLLGDGYVVRHDDGGDLIRTDLATGDTATVGSIARGSLADDRDITWTVDRFGGDVAYVDAGNAVHVVDPGVSRTAAAGTLYQDWATLMYGAGEGWYADFWLSRPVDSWTATITAVRGGKTVHTQTGGAQVGQVDASWDGFLAPGKRASSGPYRYSISATAGGVTSTIGSGTFLVWCGTPNLHDYTCTGQPTLLGLMKSPAGQAHWLTLQSGHTVIDGGVAETWAGTGNSRVTAVVPFGDITQDLHNDLLIRHADGSLRAYLGTGNPTFSGAKSIVIPGNFNHYNLIVSTGDITGDGHADLIARDAASGILYRYNGNGKGGFTGPYRLAGAYKGYSRIVGVGDFSGDGKADLLMLSGSTLYGFYGVGNGTFSGRWLFGTGYAGYNLMIGAGDVDDDGNNDLVVRDTAGGLWLIPGNGHGGRYNRVSLGAGYQKYSTIY